jgi:hypothetical protein
MTMKLLLICLVLLCLLSCKKEYCWQCHTTTTTRYSNGVTDHGTNDFEMCNKTQKEIDDYIKSNNYTKQANGVTIVFTTSCSK